MSRQYSTPTVLRMVPNSLLRQYFSPPHHDLGSIHWDGLKEREIAPLMHAIAEQPRREQDQIEAELREIHQLSDSAGSDAFAEGALRCGAVGYLEAVPCELAPYGKSMWVWLNYRDVFDKALLVHRVVQAQWWRKRDDLPRRCPDLSAEMRQRLEHEISTLLNWSQGRGRNCTAEVLAREGSIYVIAHADDFVQSATEHDDDGLLSPLKYRQTFPIVFAYSQDEGTLALSASVPAKLKRELEVIFARVLLSTELGPFEPHPVFTLDHLLDRSMSLQTDPEDRVSFRVKSMRLRPKNNGRVISVSIDEDDPADDIQKAIKESLNRKRLPRSAVSAVRAEFCAEFYPLDGRKPGLLRFEIGYPNGCSGLNDQPPERLTIVEKYLRRFRIDRSRSPVADPPATAD